MAYEVPIVSRRRGERAAEAPRREEREEPLPSPVQFAGPWTRANRAALVAEICAQTDKRLLPGEMGVHVYGELRPSSLAPALDALFERRRQPEARFLDIGAGMGAPTVAAATVYGARALGVEIVPSLFARAAAIYRADPRVRLTAGDATLIDFGAATHVFSFIAGFDPEIKRAVCAKAAALPSLRCALFVDYARATADPAEAFDPARFNMRRVEFVSTGGETFHGRFFYPRHHPRRR